MRQFLVKITLFLLLFLLPLTAFEIYVRHSNVDPFKAKRTFLEENLGSCEVLILGSSHSWCGINPNQLSLNAVNVANAFQPFYYDFKILEKYLPRMQKLRVVIIPASYTSFFNKPNHYHDDLYSIYWDLPPYNGHSIENHSLILSLGLEDLIERIRRGENHLVEKGWLKFEGSFDGSGENTGKRLKHMHGFMNTENWQESTMWLDRIIGLCRKNEVKLVLFAPPYSKAFNRQTALFPYQQKIDHYTDSLQREDVVTFYDFNDNNLFVDSLFHDTDHLNARGAKLLTGFFDLVLSQP